MPKNGSSDYFRTYLAAAVVAEPRGPPSGASREESPSSGIFEEEP
jgi:hypothetical protein